MLKDYHESLQGPGSVPGKGVICSSAPVPFPSLFQSAVTFVNPCPEARRKQDQQFSSL